MRIALTLLSIFATLGLAACGDDKGDDTSAVDTSDSGPQGFTISGTVAPLLDPAATVVGLDVSIADPTAALGGGELEILTEPTTVGADNTFSLTGVITTSTVGLLLLVEDDAGTVMPTATGVSKTLYVDIEDGATISDFGAYSIDAASQAEMQQGLEDAGYAGDLGVEGALVGFVLDSAGAPVANAVVKGLGSTAVYYQNEDGTWNTTGTVAATNSLFVIPGASIGSYSCTAEGYTFTSLLAGSQAGYAVLVRFIAS